MMVPIPPTVISPFAILSPAATDQPVARRLVRPVNFGPPSIATCFAYDNAARASQPVCALVTVLVRRPCLRTLRPKGSAFGCFQLGTGDAAAPCKHRGRRQGLRACWLCPRGLSRQAPPFSAPWQPRRTATA